MAIVDEIERIKTNISNVYDVLEEIGAEIPEDKNSDNLGVTATTIPTGGDEELVNSFISLIDSSECANCTKLPEGLTSIKAYAFYNYNYTNKMAIKTIPNTVKTIGKYAFYNCKVMPLESLPSGITTIEDFTFYYTTNLKITKIPDGVTKIGASAFVSSGAPIRELSSSLTTISSKAFGSCTNITYLDTVSTKLSSIGSISLSCPNLKTIIFRATTPPTLDSMAFNDAQNMTIYVPDESVSTYKRATNWSAHASKIKGISELPTE